MRASCTGEGVGRTGQMQRDSLHDPQLVKLLFFSCYLFTLLRLAPALFIEWCRPCWKSGLSATAAPRQAVDFCKVGASFRCTEVLQQVGVIRKLCSSVPSSLYVTVLAVLGSTILEAVQTAVAQGEAVRRPCAPKGVPASKVGST